MKRVIVEKPSNKTERYEVAETEFSGRKFLDIRTFYIKDGEWLPTKKGVMVPVEMAGDLYKAIRQVGKAYFDLKPPPGKEQEAEDKATEKVLKKKKKAKDEDDEPQKISKKAKKIGKKVAKEMLEEVDAKIKKKKKSAAPALDANAKKKKKKAVREEFSPEKPEKKKKKDKEQIAKGRKRPH